MLSFMDFFGSLPLYVIHRYYVFVFIDRANKDACLLIVIFIFTAYSPKKWHVIQL